jgi:hypothetical protein
MEKVSESKILNQLQQRKGENSDGIIKQAGHQNLSEVSEN